MREFQQRRRIKKFLHSRYAIAILVILCFFVARGVWNVYGKYEKSKEIAGRMQDSLAALQARQDSLSQQIDALSTPEGKEREIRSTFGVVKPGENLVVLMDDASATPQAALPPPSWWDRLIGFFGF